MLKDQQIMPELERNSINLGKITSVLHLAGKQALHVARNKESEFLCYFLSKQRPWWQAILHLQYITLTVKTNSYTCTPILFTNSAYPEEQFKDSC